MGYTTVKRDFSYCCLQLSDDRVSGSTRELLGGKDPHLALPEPNLLNIRWRYPQKKPPASAHSSPSGQQKSWSHGRKDYTGKRAKI